MSLKEELLKGHSNACKRNNVSSVLIKILSSTGKGFFDSIIPAIISFGNLHGPIEQTYKLLIKDEQELNKLVDRALKNNKKIPGWGNSFVKGKRDNLWDNCDKILEINHKELYKKIKFITNKLKSKKYLSKCCMLYSCVLYC